MQRSSSRSIDDESLFVPPSKCRCEKCPLHHISKPVQSERDRIFSNKQSVLKAIENSIDDVTSDLEQLVMFQSVSVEPSMLLESCKAIEWISSRLAELKFKTYEYPIPDNPANCFVDPHQKVVFAKYFSSPTKKTLLIYGHLDVLPVKADCWLSDPFRLVVKDNMFYGRGVTSGKGMLVGWLQAIECWLKIHGDLPLNIKFIVDMLHEVGSTGLQDYITSRSEFFLDVDYMVFDVNSWLNNAQPVVACSLAGWAYFGIEVRGANKNLESGLASGLVFEPMVDLCHFMNNLVNAEHEIQIPGIESNVKRLTTPEWHLLESAEFRTYEYREDLFVRRLRYEDNKVELLQNRWCKPTLSMHGVEGADVHPGCRQILPMKVMGKFSIKLVPDQELSQVIDSVKDFLLSLKAEQNVNTLLNVHLLDGIDPCSWAQDSKLMKVVCRALESVYESEPITTSAIPICLPIANVLQKLINKPVILMPYSRRTDKHHNENERIESLSVMRHAKACSTLFVELSSLRSKCKCNIIQQYCNLRGVQEILDAGRISVDKNEGANRWKFLNKLRNAESDSPKSKSRNSFKKFLSSTFGCAKKPKKRSTKSK
ncbi:cytosolic non-specific dipeptidase-like [Drosophila hydei]|uniref:Cytosolic non-specific dipeptidase-like n=1 Tax=Drosophila hydei TaxID=7224 RepID=A0A6J1LXM3_DROHY|nr:cytosolic non-specific dipeptidase-like [Drosophila hydei]